MMHRTANLCARNCARNAIAVLGLLAGSAYAVTTPPDRNLPPLTEDFGTVSESVDIQATVGPINYALVSNSDPSLVTVQNLDTLTGTFDLTSLGDAFGTATLLFSAADADLGQPSSTWSLNITITDVNDPPSFVAGGNQTVGEDSGPAAVAGWATAIDVGPANEGQSPVFSVGVDDPTLFAVQPAVDSGGSLSFAPAPDAVGTANVSVSLSDGVDSTPDQSFTITITDVNDPPSFVAGGNQTVGEDSGPAVVAGWATAIDVGPANESQTPVFTVGVDDPTLFAIQPAVDSGGSLTYTPAPDAVGTASVSVSLSDGVDSTPDQSFTITITDVNDPPSFVGGPNQTVMEDVGPVTVTGWATAISSGPANEGQTPSFTVVNDNGGLFAAAPAVDATTGTLTFEPMGNETGLANVTVTLSDGVATFDQSFTIAVGDVNDAPTFSAGGDQNVLEDSGPATVPAWATAMTAGPPNESGQTLSFTTSNDNSSLFSAAPAVDSAGDLTFTPAADAVGSAVVTVTLSDDGGVASGGVDSASAAFTITVGGVNDAPSFTSGGDQSVLEDSPPAVIAGWATALSTGPADEAGQTLSFTLSNDNGALFSAAPAIDAGGTLTFTPAPDAVGSALVTVVLSDDGGTANGGVDNVSDTFAVTVGAVNDEPGFTAGADQVVFEDMAPVLVSGWATAITLGPVDESSQTATFTVVGNTNPALFGAPPAVDGATGDLTFTPAANMVGSATISLRLVDDGGTASGGDDTSPAQTFDITVTPVNDVPTFTLGPNVAVNEDISPQTLVNWATGISAGPPDESSQTLVFSVANNNPSLFSAQPALDDAGTLTFTPVPDASGVATVTVRLSDNGGTANGGVDTTPDATFTISVGAVNDVPSFAAGGDQIVLEDQGTITVPGWATSLSAGPADESGQVLTFTVVSNTNPGLFGTAPAIDGSSGDLTFAPAANANGSATISVAVRDDGGTLGGGVDTSASQSFDVTVTAVNDAPTFTPGPSVSVAEDSGPVTFNGWATSISPGPADESAQTVTFSVDANSNPAMFLTQPAIDAVTGNLTFETLPDANGTANITITLSDDGGTANGGADTSAPLSFTIGVSGVNDLPSAGDDAIVIDEDSGPVLIPVLINDYIAEPPTTITQAGVGGFSEGVPSVVLDENDDPLDGPNGTVTVVGTEISYEPKADFYGDDYFTYTITDVDGDVATATVTVTVNPVNDPPRAPALRSFTMIENGSLTVEAADGLLFGAYDVEGSLLDAGGVPVGSTLTIQVQTLPASGVVSVDNLDGTFTYTPAVDFTGEVRFTYRVSDGAALSAGAAYEARILVFEAPEPPPPPPAGEVATVFNLANVPLEQSTSVDPNVIVMMDDSGSMDWNMSVRGADTQGGFVIDNDWVASSGRYSTSYYYLWDLNNNIFGTTDGNGRILPTEDELEADGDLNNNRYGVWRARNAQYNRLYYNPEVQYTPWVGQDGQNIEFGNAVPTAIRLDPRDPYNTFNILNTHSYYADNVPRWRSSGGREDMSSVSVYIPHYYSTTGTPPLVWNDPHTLVEIRAANAPFMGSASREDCAADDGDPLTCTYEQEIQNFANFFQYYRTREYAAKNGLGKVIAEVQDIRVGYETINDNRSEPVRDMNELHTEGNKKSLMDDIYRTNSSGGTPLRRALDRAGDIFSGSHGDDPLLPAPEGFCQQNFTLLFSDGYWNGSDPSQNNEDGDGPGPFDGGVYADGRQETLADVAMYFYERDLRPTMDDLVPVSQRDRLGAPVGTFSGGAARMHQHMKTYTVAFGVVGDVDPSTLPTNPTVPFAWPDPEGAPQGKIDDMLHAAVNGRGQFLSAVNPQELQTALESAFLEFTQAASSTSAAAFNSTSLQEGTLLYRGFYDLRDFTGELSATRVNSDGTLAPTPEWLASEQLDPANKTPNNRVLVTFDPMTRNGRPFRAGGLTPGQQLIMSDAEVNYVRGVRSSEQPLGPLRQRGGSGALLGDIVNSSPVFVGNPLGLDRDQAPYPVATGERYTDYKASVAGRTPMVYVGANDGILHGFDALTGEERFGYIPNKVIDGTQRYRNLLEEFTSPFYQHKYFVDLSPRLSDAYVRPAVGSLTQSWNTVMVGGLGAGGKGFFALNVSNPDIDFTSEANASDVVLWEFTDEDDTYPVHGGTPLGGSVGAVMDPSGAPVKDLGYALSLPTMAMSNVSNGTQQEWVAIFGNGPNSTAGYAKLFVLFMDRGLDGWDPGDFVKLNTGRGVPVAPNQLAGYPNGLGTPALVDTDLNGTVDWVYAGDRLGNLYRFDLCDRQADGKCSGDPSAWSVTRLFTATYDEGGFQRLQPILTQPLVVKHPSEDGFLVIFGTGSYVTLDDADSQEIQSIYAIWDRGEDSPYTAQDDTKALRLVEQTLTNVVDDSVSPPQTRRVLSRNPVDYEPEALGVPGTFGWYVDLDMPRATHAISGAVNSDSSGQAPPGPQFPGEKAIRRLLLRNGAVITTTVLPSLDEFSCFGTRPGAILVLDSVTGGDVERPVIDFNNDGVIDDGDLVNISGEAYSAGLLFNQSDLDGALVDLSTLGGEGDTDWLFACGGNDCVPFRLEPPIDSRVGRLSWRELDINN